MCETTQHTDPVNVCEGDYTAYRSGECVRETTQPTDLVNVCEGNHTAYRSGEEGHSVSRQYHI